MQNYFEDNVHRHSTLEYIEMLESSRKQLVGIQSQIRRGMTLDRMKDFNFESRDARGGSHHEVREVGQLHIEKLVEFVGTFHNEDNAERICEFIYSQQGWLLKSSDYATSDVHMILIYGRALR
jgi:hypothetical protein